MFVEVCWRKLAGTEDSSRHPKESTENRPARRLRVDSSVEAFWASVPDNFGFEASCKRRPRVEDAGLVGCKEIERSELGKSADGELQIGLNGRSVAD